MGKERKDFAENFSREETSFKDLMSELFAIKGYKAAAILTSDGEVLYNSAPPGTSRNFGAWMGVFNSLFDHTCNLSESSGFLACQQVAMRTGEEIVIIRSSGQDCGVGVRLLVIIDHHGNETMVHQKLDQLLPPLMGCLTWDPDNLTFLYLENIPGDAEKYPGPVGKKAGAFQ